MEKQMKHEGIVASINGDTMVVRIVASSACAGCAAKSHCVPSGNQYRDIRADGFSGEFAAGERVTVVMRQSLGIRALCIGYVLPFAAVLATLLTVYQITANELASGLSALLILLPYYLTVKLFHRKITKTFGVTVQKINTV